MLQNLIKEKSTIIIGVIFIIIGIVASELLVLDEEALVAACFILFVLFAYQVLGDMIAVELDDRGNKIQEELEKSIQLKRKLLTDNVNLIEKQKSLATHMISLSSFTLDQIIRISNRKTGLLKSKISNLINQQLRLVLQKEKEILNSLQKETINSLINSVLQEFTNPDLRKQFLEESIRSIKSINR